MSPLIVLVLAVYIGWVRHVSPDIWITYLLVLTALAMLSGVVFDRLFPEGVRRRAVLRHILLWMCLTVITIHIISCLSPVHWVTGHPGDSVDFHFHDGLLYLELDYSNTTQHGIAHGASGYVQVELPIVFALPVLLPLTFIMWFDVINRRLPWLNQCYPPGHCQTCGYNLTGNTSGICPECGVKIPD